MRGWIGLALALAVTACARSHLVETDADAGLASTPDAGTRLVCNSILKYTPSDEVATVEVFLATPASGIGCLEAALWRPHAGADLGEGFPTIETPGVAKIQVAGWTEARCRTEPSSDPLTVVASEAWGHVCFANCCERTGTCVGPIAESGPGTADITLRFETPPPGLQPIERIEMAAQVACSVR
jgi:hypothetical protein